LESNKTSVFFCRMCVCFHSVNQHDHHRWESGMSLSVSVSAGLLWPS